MAQLPEFPDATRIHLAEQLSHRFLSSINDERAIASELELCETPEVWAFDAGIGGKADRRMADVARRTGRWHHQICQRKERKHYARSRPIGPSSED